MLKNYQTYGLLQATLNGANKQLEFLIIITANTSYFLYRSLIDVEDMCVMGVWDEGSQSDGKKGENIFDCSLFIALSN